MRAYRAARAFDGERMVPGGATVLLDGDTIIGVEPATVELPVGCPVTDLPGATLLPGLIDTHVHLCGDGSPAALDRFPELTDDELDAIIGESLAAQLAAGVTAVRDLGDASWAVADRHRQHTTGPTVVAAGPPITCPGGHCAGMGGEAAGIDGLRAAVRERVEHGVDVVKVMTSGGAMTAGTDTTQCQFTVEEMRALVDEAHRWGLPVTAHAHALTAVEMCVAVGVDGIEHCTCITDSGIALRAGLGEALATADIDVCPTLGRAPGLSPPPRVLAEMARTGFTFEGRLQLVGRLHRAGVRLSAGADSGIGPSKRHGIMRESVVELVDAGLPPVAALAAGTSVAARACGIADRTGRLAPGLDADLIAVDGDPSKDITALRSVRLAVSRGREAVGPAAP